MICSSTQPCSLMSVFSMVTLWCHECLGKGLQAGKQMVCSVGFCRMLQLTAHCVFLASTT